MRLMKIRGKLSEALLTILRKIYRAEGIALIVMSSHDEEGGACLLDFDEANAAVFSEGFTYFANELAKDAAKISKDLAEKNS